MGLYTLIHKTLTPIVKRLYRVELIDAENEPEDTPFMVCPNHLSIADVLIVAACMKHEINFLAKAELFRFPVLKQFFNSVGAIPVKRGTADVTAIKTMIKRLDDGNVLGLYPQGTRCKGVDPRTTEVKSGVGMVAYRSKVKVMPICIQTKGFKIKPFRRTRVTFGKPIEFDELGFEKGNMAEYVEASKVVFGRVTDMLVPDGDMIK